jgi:hypothetical protein
MEKEKEKEKDGPEAKKGYTLFFFFEGGSPILPYQSLPRSETRALWVTCFCL